MEFGLLWFDKGNGDLGHKVERAAHRYKERFGKAANVCYVHPGMLTGDTLHVGRITVRTSHRIRPHHFYVGEEHST